MNKVYESAQENRKECHATGYDDYDDEDMPQNW